MRTDGRTDGQMDMTKLKVACRNFAAAPKKVCVCIASNVAMEAKEIRWRQHVRSVQKSIQHEERAAVSQSPNACS